MKLFVGARLEAHTFFILRFLLIHSQKNLGERGGSHPLHNLMLELIWSEVRLLYPHYYNQFQFQVGPLHNHGAPWDKTFSTSHPKLTGSNFWVENTKSDLLGVIPLLLTGCVFF